MTRRFNFGNQVTICMVSGRVFGWINHLAIIMWIPADTGDCFQFQLLDDYGNVGDLIMINPNCTEFGGLIMSGNREDK